MLSTHKNALKHVGMHKVYNEYK